MSSWTDELKQKAQDMYLEREPNAENTMDIVNEVAEELGMAPNGVRMVLTKAGVYVTKAAKASKPKAEGAAKTGGTRVNKEGAQAALTEAIEAAGKDVDADIISKLTGKAAQYFAAIIKDLS